MKINNPGTPIENFLPQDAEIIIKPKKRVGAYDAFSNNPSTHLRRVGWQGGFNFNWPEDVALGIETSINRKDISKFQEIYFRFLNLGFIDQYGDHCVLITAVLRKVLAYHGIKSTIKQVTSYWQNEEKGQLSTTGVFNGHGDGRGVADGSIDAHVVVSANGFILDFSMLPIHYKFGHVAPKACIGLDTDSDEYQNFGLAGEAAWVEVKPIHPIIKHWRLEQKPMEQDLIRQYFRQYQF